MQHAVQEEEPMQASSVGQIDEMPSRTYADKALTSCSEERLVAEAKRGSHAAFEKLVESYRARLFRMARMIAHGHEDAEDVVQQSFHKAFLHLSRFENRSSFSTWLTRIALNEVLMLKRSRRRFCHVSIDAIDEPRATEEVAPVLEIADSKPNPERSYSQQEQRRLLLSAIKELRPGMRDVLQVRDLEERSLRETARILGLTVNAVKSRLCRGRRQLREKLKKSYGTARNRKNARSRRNPKLQFAD
jgi:RNA polymerase sigma-70 factor, ECF subfamily